MERRFVLVPALFLFALISKIDCLTLKVQYPSTCLKLQGEYENDKLLINFHQNLQMGSSQLKVYNVEGAMIADSGPGATYQHYLQVNLPVKGEYSMCFENPQAKQLQVSFEILREEEQLSYAGKEDLGRITRRVSDFLVEIKKSNWAYKQLLAQHNKWGEKFRDYEAKNYILYAAKLAAMVCILSVQIWIVKKVFD